MNGTTQRDPYTALLLERRFLLTQSLADYPRGLMVLSVDGTAPYSTAGFSLSLCAPGLGMEADVLRGNLARWLDKTLPALEFEWVAEVGIERHTQTGEPLIGVVINNPGFLGAESVDRVLDAARLYLAPSARTNWKRLVTLRKEQRLVPLHFETDEIYPRDLRVQLPKELTLGRPRIVSCERHDDPADQGAAFLKAELEMVLDHYELNELISDVFVRATPNGVTISLPFSGRTIDRPAWLLNEIEETVCGVVSRHASLLKSFYTDLVFVPAYPHRALTDDGGDYGPRDEEY